MPGTQAVYYRDTRGVEPARDYRATLADAARAAFDFHVELLNQKAEDAPPPGFPTTSQVRGQLRELRCRSGGVQHRVLYQRSHNLVVLLHAFPKNTGRLPDADIELAARRFEDFRTRMDTPSRRSVRPAGADAP
jgi:phage-related protein